MTANELLSTYRLKFWYQDIEEYRVFFSKLFKTDSPIEIDKWRTQINYLNTSQMIGDSQTVISTTPTLTWDYFTDLEKKKHLEHYANKLGVNDFYPYAEETDISNLFI